MITLIISGIILFLVLLVAIVMCEFSGVDVINLFFALIVLALLQNSWFLKQRIDKAIEKYEISIVERENK